MDIMHLCTLRYCTSKARCLSLWVVACLSCVMLCGVDFMYSMVAYLKCNMSVPVGGGAALPRFALWHGLYVLYGAVPQMLDVCPCVCWRCFSVICSVTWTLFTLWYISSNAKCLSLWMVALLSCDLLCGVDFMYFLVLYLKY